MATIRYYPLSRIQTNLHTNGTAYALNGKPYKGSYYLTYAGDAYTGENPLIGGNELLAPITAQKQSTYTTLSDENLNSTNNRLAKAQSALLNKAQSALSKGKQSSLDKATQAKSNKDGTLKQVAPYYPLVLESDYSRGYFMRYFAKRIADRGYIMEVTVDDWNLIKGGSDPTYMDYELESMMWQLVGPLQDKRVSPYQVVAGVETTNKRITEGKAKSFIGLVEFIGGDYTKFARITK